MKPHARLLAAAAVLAALAALAAPAAHAATARERAQKLMKTLAKDSDPRERADAARELGSMGATDAVPALLAAMKDSDRNVRMAASSAIWKLKEAARPNLAEIRKAFDDSSGWPKLNLGGALEDLGTDREELVEGYRRVLESNDTSARVEAARRLQGHVPDKELLPTVSEALKSDDSEVRSDAQDVMRKLKVQGAGSTELNDALLRQIHNKNSSVRGDAVRQLSRMKPVPKDAVPEILDALEDSESSVRRSVCSALGTMGAPYAAQSVPKLIVVLQKDEDMEIRAAAASALGEIGPSAKAAIPALIEALKKDKESKVREAACEGLQGMGKTAKEAIPALEAAQKDSDGFVRNAAWRALLRVDPKH